MLKTSYLKNISLALFGTVVILLILNTFITKYVEKDDQPKNRESISGIKVDSLFKTALGNYGFSNNWIVKKKLKNVSGDSLYVTYSVSVPKDIPIHLILLELKKIFWDYEVEINAEEIDNSNKTKIKLSSDNKLKLAAELFYDKNIKREFGTIAFLIKDLPLDTEEGLTSFLSTPELFYAVIIPKDLSKKRLPVISKSGKRYALLLDDNIEELNYKLSASYSDDKIKKSIKEIVGTFHNSAFFIIDDKSDIVKSKKYPLIKSELDKRGIIFVHSSELEIFPTSKVNPEDNFQEFIKTLNKKDEKVLLISANDFSTILGVIPSYRKVGYKIIYPGNLMLKSKVLQQSLFK